MPSTPVANGRVEKPSKKQTKIVTLKLSSSTLSKFIPKEESPSVASSPAPTQLEDLPALKPVLSHDNHSETNSTPAPAQDASILEDDKKKSSSTNGVKRSTPMPPDSMGKPRGKPGPKKKPRLRDDGTIDHVTKPVVTSTVNHKLGPKANTGFINANLRALDRSGAPCRRWQKSGFQLKSFTGHAWELPSWKGLDKSSVNGNGDLSSGQDASMLDSSDQKQSEGDTAHGSNAGDPIDRMDVNTPAASSPAPMPVSSAILIQS